MPNNFPLPSQSSARQQSGKGFTGPKPQTAVRRPNSVKNGDLTSFGLVDNLNDPLLTFKWCCLSAPFNAPVLHVEAVSIPFPHLDIKEGLFGASTYTYYPGFESIDAFDVTFYEDVKMTTSKWLKEWYERVRDPNTGGFYLPREYKRDLMFALMDQEGSICAEITLVNAWPAGRGNMDLNFTDEGRIQIQQNFSCDRQHANYL